MQLLNEGADVDVIVEEIGNRKVSALSLALDKNINRLSKAIVKKM